MINALKHKIWILTAIVFMSSCQTEEFELSEDMYSTKTEEMSIAMDDKFKEFDENEHFINAKFEGNFWWNAEVELFNEPGDYETDKWFTMTPTRNFGTREITLFLSRNIEKHHDRKIEIT